MTLYHYPGCSTCRRARSLLRERGVEPTLVDIVKAPPSAAALRDLWQRSGLPLKRLFNVSGQSYRSGGFAARLPSMSEDAQLAALAADGKLIKRPLLDTGTAVLVGFDAQAYSAIT